MRASFPVLVVAVVMSAGCRGGKGETSSQAPPSPGAMDPAMAPGAGRFSAQVSGVDAKEGRIVLSLPSTTGGGALAALKSVPVAESARGELEDLKPGDHVVVACQAAGGAPAAVEASAPPPSAAAAASAEPPAEPTRTSGNDGIGASASGDDLRTCVTVVGLARTASASGR
jgi:hypothetical protein